MENNIFKYNDTEITFLSGNKEVMINATEMAKAFEKQPSDWTKTKSSQDFISSLSAVRNIFGTDLVKVVQGGSNQGTWMHEDVAIEFSRWLSPAFAIWCNDRIKELMRFGMTATQPTLEAMVNNPDLIIGLAQKLKEERAEKERLQLTVELQAPKVLFASAVETSQKSCLIGEIAKIIKQNGVDMGEKRLFDWMRKNGYLCAYGERYNQPTQKSMDLGLFEIKKTTITKPSGEVLVSTTSKITGKGQIYFVGKFLRTQPAY